MKPGFRTLRELKRHLPEVLERIKACRLYAEAERALMYAGLDRSVDWTHPDEYVWYETEGAIRESYKNSMLYDMEADWLQSQVDKLKGAPEI